MSTKMGAPRKITPEAQEKVLDAIRKGSPLILACNYAGFSYKTLNYWRIRTEENGEPDFAEFFEKLKIAKGEAAYKWLEKIEEAIEDGQWQAAAWKLERRYFRYFGRSADIMELAKKMDKIESKLKSESSKNHITENLNGDDLDEESSH